jgi:hypothetical protein
MTRGCPGSREEVDTFLAQLDQAETWLAFAPELPAGVDLEATTAAIGRARADAEALYLAATDVTPNLAELQALVEAVLGLPLDAAAITNEP